MSFEIILLSIILNADVFSLMTDQGARLRKVKYWQILAASVLIAPWQLGSLYLSQKFLGIFIGDLSGLSFRSMNNLSALIYLTMGLYFINKSNKKVEIKEVANNDISIKDVFKAAVLTSIDAAVVGIALGLRQVEIKLLNPYVLIFTILAVSGGVYIGRYYGPDRHKVSQLISGILYVILAAYVYVK